MDKNRVVGAAKEASGSINEAAGKLIGNGRLRLSGTVGRVEGEILVKAGMAKDAGKSVLR